MINTKNKFFFRKINKNITGTQILGTVLVRIWISRRNAMLLEVQNQERVDRPSLRLMASEQFFSILRPNTIGERGCTIFDESL